MRGFPTVPMLALVALMVIALWLRGSGPNRAGPVQFPLRSLFIWTAVVAIWMFFAVRDLLAAILVGYAVAYVLGFVGVLDYCERVRASRFARLAIFAYMTIVPAIILYILSAMAIR